MSLKFINEKVDDWFFHTRATKPRTTNGISFGGRAPLKKGSGLTNLQAAAKKHPEVMVKIPKRLSKNSKGLNAVSNHLSYVSRNGEVPLETNLGEKLHGNSEVRALLDDWRKLNVPDESKHREALNIVLSMPKGTPPEAVLNAARNFAAEQFEHHAYAFGLHHESERDGEPEHPHVHLCVLMRDENGRRINPRKHDLFEWRVRFAEKLRDEGVECAATRRQHRGRVQKQGWEKGIAGYIEQRAERTEKRSYIAKREIDELANALSQQKKPNNPYIQQTLETRGMIVAEYGMIARQLYQHGYKTEANLIKKFSEEVAKQDINTRIQQKYDERNPKPTQTIEQDDGWER